jgi:peptidoglycan/LPS O-acetylase OafA/YrhL
MILGVIAVQFILPFVLLLSRRVKRSARALAVVASLVLLARFADLYWLVAPAFDATAPRIHLLDVTTLLAVGGVWIAAFVALLEKRPLVPLADPSLAEVP